MKIVTTALSIPMIFISTAVSANILSTYGTATEKACVNLIEPTTQDLLVQIKQTIWDTNDVDTQDTNFIIYSDSHGTYCDTEVISHDIYVNGKVAVNWTIRDLENNEILAQFNTESHFNGEGANNDWDLNEKGQCGSEESYGVYLVANNMHSCGAIYNVPDESEVLAVFAPKIEPKSSEHPKDSKLADLSGGLVGNALQGSGAGLLHGVSHKYYARIEDHGFPLTPYYYSGVGIDTNSLQVGKDYMIHVDTGLWLGKNSKLSCQRISKNGVCSQDDFSIGLIPEANPISYQITYLGDCAKTLPNGQKAVTPLFSQATLLSNTMNNGLPRARNVRVNRYNSPVVNDMSENIHGDCDVNKANTPIDLAGNPIHGCGNKDRFNKWPQCVKMVDLNDWFE
ncbi:hypothetical protein [Vibrio sagamiensis]|uniref:Uncharacterized protein n=1 Tax=Vibrio sagamiensis NBRC 104589 TaxID=1219064 RepID=A0A511QAZ5_9VIBR|nr:hypothetical protein [Vibrio sagamiensis]PNQ55053.1 hypothetical protein C1141_14700 [Vibrio agarivorans]GEM74418.1 hypothetical protein VSA01S_05300 [Vibrio sagamiensis NBRC 104589]